MFIKPMFFMSFEKAKPVPVGEPAVVLLVFLQSCLAQPKTMAL